MVLTSPRPPVGAAETVADALRVVALVCMIVAAAGWGPVAGATLALVAGGMIVPRLVSLRPSVDIAFGVVLLTAAWSSVLGIYLTTLWWDLPMHFLANGLCAALLYILLVRLGAVADASTLPHPVASAVTVTTALGLTLGVVWEILEWFGHTFIDEAILVGYTDTIGDLVWGGAGSILAGFLMAHLARAAGHGPRPPRSGERPPPSAGREPGPVAGRHPAGFPLRSSLQHAPSSPPYISDRYN